jgi:hypothetical protein
LPAVVCRDRSAAHRLDKDWGRSGATDKTDKREAFLDLMAAVERGEVSAIYAYSAEWAERLRNAPIA